MTGSSRPRGRLPVLVVSTRSIAGFMLDTSAISRICDRHDDALALIADIPCFVTDIQLQELFRTPDFQRRERLKETILNWNIRVLRADVSSGGFDEDDVGEGRPLGRLWPAIAANQRGGFKRNINDALIAETARIHNLTLVTADKGLAAVSRKFGVSVSLIAS